MQFASNINIRNNKQQTSTPPKNLEIVRNGREIHKEENFCKQDVEMWLLLLLLFLPFPLLSLTLEKFLTLSNKINALSEKMEFAVCLIMKIK